MHMQTRAAHAVWAALAYCQAHRHNRIVVQLGVRCKVMCLDVVQVYSLCHACKR